MEREIKRRMNEAKITNDWGSFAHYIHSLKHLPEFKTSVENLILNSPVRNTELLHFLSFLFVDAECVSREHWLSKFDSEIHYALERDHFTYTRTSANLFSRPLVLIKVLSLLNEEMAAMQRQNEESEMIFQSNVSCFHFSFCKILSYFIDTNLDKVLSKKENLLTFKTFCENCLMFVFGELKVATEKENFSSYTLSPSIYEMVVFEAVNRFLLPQLQLRDFAEYERIARLIFLTSSITQKENFRTSLERIIRLQVKLSPPQPLVDKFFDEFADVGIKNLEEYITDDLASSAPSLGIYHVHALETIDVCFPYAKNLSFTHTEKLRATNVGKAFLKFANKISNYVYATFFEKRDVLSSNQFLQLEETVHRLVENKLCDHKFLSFCFDNTWQIKMTKEKEREKEEKWKRLSNFNHIHQRK